MIIAARRALSGNTVPPGGGTPGAHGVPYPMPTSAPYNAPTYCVTPTPDGTGCVVHPGVIDFGSGFKWRGYRFWMAVTGFYLGNDDVENPIILGSNDGFHWEDPPGLTNPVYPTPPGSWRWNSDTDLEYDPRSDELVLLYREVLIDATQQSLIARSPDGVTWPARAHPINWTRPEDTGQVLSPALIRRGDGDWWLFGIFKRLSTLVYYRASAPEGPWTGPSTATALPADPWHIDVIWDGAAFRAILDHLYPGAAQTSLGSSADGQTWAWGPNNVLIPSASGWDSAQLYRSTLTPHEDGIHNRVWYSADGPESWRAGLTQMPRSIWPSPPA